tara:strand:- start:436 stop:921 length:486 start_codon:yes stop_codon:yes gene_type:complete
MKYLLILLACTGLYSQDRVLDINNLPEVVKDETVTIKDEVWIEPIDSEIKQRHEINLLKKRIDKIHSILKDKENVKHNLDSLLFVINDLSNERDSLNNALKSGVVKVSSDCTNRVAFLNDQLKNVRNQYFSIRKKHQRLKKKTALIIGVCIVEGVLIIVLI